MTLNAETPTDARSFPQVASWRHLGIVVAIILAIAVQGAMGHSRARSSGSGSRIAVYVLLIVFESALIFLVWRGIKKTGTTLRDLIGGRWQSPRDVIRDMGVALAVWGSIIFVAIVWRIFRPDDRLPATVTELLPRTSAEIILWLLVAISAGVAEEIAFRGYLQRQFAALTGNQWIALVIQALLFGVSHGYQGVEATLRITLLGLIFGIFAITRRSLRPGIIAHTWTDMASGIFRAG